MNAKFGLGRLAATPGALREIEASGQTPDFFLERHLQGDWGDVEEQDWKRNDQALVDGSRLFSVYRSLRGTKLYVITEATDDEGQRAATTIVLPEEY